MNVAISAELLDDQPELAQFVVVERALLGRQTLLLGGAVEPCRDVAVHQVLLTILELKEGLEQAQFNDQTYRESEYMRLNVINKLSSAELLTNNLEWSHSLTTVGVIH